MKKVILANLMFLFLLSSCEKEPVEIPLTNCTPSDFIGTWRPDFSKDPQYYIEIKPPNNPQYHINIRGNDSYTSNCKINGDANLFIYSSYELKTINRMEKEDRLFIFFPGVTTYIRVK